MPVLRLFANEKAANEFASTAENTLLVPNCARHHRPWLMGITFENRKRIDAGGNVRAFRGAAPKTVSNCTDLVTEIIFPDRLKGAAISDLGILSLPPATVAAILIATFRCLRSGTFLYQLTYGPRCPVP